MRLSHVSIYVLDQDEAKDFYTKKLGFDVRNDEVLDGFRRLTVGSPEQPDVEFVLTEPNPPVFDAESAAQLRAMIAKGAMGTGVMATEDCRATHRELADRGVQFLQEPTDRPYGIEATFATTRALVQPHPDSPAGLKSTYPRRMHDDLRNRVSALFPQLRATLADLVRIPSVSAPSYPPEPVRRSAEHIAGLLRAAGCQDVQLLEHPGAHPAVYGHIPGPPGTPTVLLYAHHDVQPPGPAGEWLTGPFEPFEKDGRLHGRGASDDKSGVIMHLGALGAHEGKPPVGVKVFMEGEEEVGSSHLDDFLQTYSNLLASDVIVIADAGVWRVGRPALFTSLRGLTACVVEVRTLQSAVHSGGFGGVFPDALTSLCRLLATLHDDQGNVAIPGLVAEESDPLDLTEAELRAAAGALEKVSLIGSGGLTSRLFSKPAISVLAIDAPTIDEAINQLVPVARAKVSMRIAPGQDGPAAVAALRHHLEQNVPWGAQLTISDEGYGDAFKLETEGTAYDAFRQAMAEAWGVEAVEAGVGGSIPFVASFSERMEGAPILLIGAGDPTSSIHGPNESQDLDDLEKAVLAEAIALRLLAG